jgi:hypothetical protein
MQDVEGGQVCLPRVTGGDEVKGRAVLSDRLVHQGGTHHGRVAAHDV